MNLSNLLITLCLFNPVLTQAEEAPCQLYDVQFQHSSSTTRAGQQHYLFVPQTTVRDPCQRSQRGSQRSGTHCQMDKGPAAHTGQETAGRYEGEAAGLLEVFTLHTLSLCTYLILFSFSVKRCQVRSWGPFSQLQKVCQTVCSSMSKPRRSWMIQRPWRTSPSGWGRGSWRPCCRGWVRREKQEIEANCLVE